MAIQHRVVINAATPTVKICSKCAAPKPLNSFAGNGNGSRRSACKDCINADRRARGVSARRRQSESTEDRLTRKLLEEYKITREQYTALIDAQDGACAICAKVPDTGKRLAVDHCHATGKVRALLCTPCNVAVGFHEKYGQAAAEYLTKYGDGHPVLEQ
jgi:hypothetical protein